jgi:ABC-type dipeptide/oligopeptide/nickel transport system permease subunit
VGVFTNGVITVFIPLAVAILIGVYAASFKDEFDEETWNLALTFACVVCVVQVLLAVLRSLW